MKQPCGLMAEPPNHYAVLGLTRAFDEQQLKRQYRLLALKYHPDRNRGDEDEASRHFKLIAEAHAVLGDPKARRAYDLEQLKQMALNRRRPQPGARSRQHAAPPPVPPPVPGAPTGPAHVHVAFYDAGVNCGEIPAVDLQSPVHTAFLPTLALGSPSTTNNPNFDGFQTGNNFVAVLTALVPLRPCNQPPSPSP